MSLRLAVVRVLRDLNDLGIEHAVIGGLAVSARVEPRMTRDVDIVIAAVAQARIAVRQIVERGFGRGRDLATALQRLTAPGP